MNFLGEIITKIFLLKMLYYVRILLLCLLGLQECFCRKYYDNYTLYRGIPLTTDHLDFYNNLTTIYDANFWKPPGQLNKPIDFIIGPADKPAFFRDVNRNGLYLTTVIDDVQE